MMLTHIYFVRHAHSTFTSDEYLRPLSERGFSDAKKVTQLLLDEKIDCIVSSPYKRAIQTVEGLTLLLNKNIQLDERLRERQLAAEPVNDFAGAIIKVWSNFDFSYPGGESNHQAQLRGVQALHEFLEKYNGKRIVVSSHGNLIALVMNAFDPQYGFEFWNKLDMPDIYQLTFEGFTLEAVKRFWSR